MTSHGLEDLNLSGEEVERLTNAFKDEHFRTLFAEYAAELNDPEQRAIYEAEVTALERQRGVDARFLHPTPGWVLRTSQSGSRRCYINICSNPLVGRPEARQEPGGCCWLLPHCLAPGREELSRSHPRGPHRLVYDVVFHPETLRLAASLGQFRRLVNDTALEVLEKKFSLQLDRANAVPLRRIKYKGVPQATLLRTPLPEGTWRGPEEDGDDSPLPHFPSPYTYPPPKPQYETTTPFSPPPKVPPAPAATIPKWNLRHRSYVDLQDYRNSRDSVPSPIPRELVVTIELPLLSSASQAQLEILGQELQLDSQRPATYHLRLPLPYPVDEGRGRATFNKAKKQLVVVLPVLQKPDSRPAFGVQTPQQQTTTSPENEGQLQKERATIPDENGAEPSNTEQTLRVHCASVNSAALPAAGVEIVSALPPAVAARNDTLDVPLNSQAPCNDTELPVHTSEIDSSVPCASTFSGALPACNENIRPGDPLLTRNSSNVVMYEQPEGTSSDSLAPFLYSESISEPPARPVSLVNQEHLCNINNVELPVCPDSRMVPCIWPSDNRVEHAEITLSTHDCCRLDESPEFSGGSDTAYLSSASHTEHSDLCPGKRAIAVSAHSARNYEVDVPIISACNADPSESPVSPLCPPFHCTQDENTVMLLLQVPDIVPQSFKGKVGINHYSGSFENKDSVSYIFHLQFPPENKLTYPEIEINVSHNNVFITLAKSPETTGIWTKLYFGSNYDDLQERWFITENSVDKFLNNLEGISCSSSSQSDIEHHPLIEVLDISEGRSQIRVKQIEENSSLEPGKIGKEDNDKECGNRLSPDAENCSVQTKSVLDSFTTVETMKLDGKESSHCLEHDPGDPSLTNREKLQINESHESELCLATGKGATSSVQAQLNQEQPVPISQGEEVGVHSESSQNKQGLDNRPAPVVLKETNMQDGSVKYISCHTTQCAITLQNTLLYELD